MITVPKSKDVEFHPDAWERFERAASVVTKAPPQHRKAKKKLPKQRKQSKTQKPV
jgi:hypothetical protein